MTIEQAKTVLFSNKQHYTTTGPGLLWTQQYGIWPLLDKLGPQVQALFTLAHQSTDCELTSELFIQSHIKTTNFFRFAFIGMKLNLLHTFIQIGNTNTYTILLRTLCAYNPVITSVSHKAIHCLATVYQSAINQSFISY